MTESEKYNRVMEKATADRMAKPGQLAPRDQQKGLIPTWSFSTLKSFEKCPLRVKLSKVDKMPEGVQHPAAARGNRVHDAAEQYVDGSLKELPRELEKVRHNLDELREYYKRGDIELEQEWGFTKEWAPCSWEDTDLWGKMKLDVFHWDSDDRSSARVIDYKTGKSKGNEINHTDQGIVYSLGAFMRYPSLKFIQTEFWYTDEGFIRQKELTREQMTHLLAHLENRAYALTTCTVFPPHASAGNCKYCPHSETDSCEYAIGIQ